MNENRHNFSLTNSNSFLSNIHSDLLKSQTQHQAQTSSKNENNTGDQLTQTPEDSNSVQNTKTNTIHSKSKSEQKSNPIFNVPQLTETKVEDLNFSKLKIDNDSKTDKTLSTTATTTSSSSTASSTSTSTNTTISTTNLAQSEGNPKQRIEDSNTNKSLEKTQFSKSIGNLDIPRASKDKQFNAAIDKDTNHQQQRQQMGNAQNLRQFNNGNQMLSKSMSIKCSKKQRPAENNSSFKLNRYSSAITAADLVASNSNFPIQNPNFRQNISANNAYVNYQKRKYSFNLRSFSNTSSLEFLDYFELE